MYLYRTSTGPVDLAFTDRYGGVSAAPFESLNLALVGEDDPRLRQRNVEILLDDFAPGARLADMEQVHGARVVEIADGEEPREQCDALVTDTPDVVLMVRVADCVPVLLADPDRRVVGAAHAGRVGLVAGVVPACVRRMRELGAAEIVAHVGPRICGACYEVPADLQEEVSAVVPSARSTTSWGTPALDVGAGVRAQLAEEGVRVQDLPVCTRESPDLYSYRRDGAHAGRSAGVIRIRP